MRVFFSLTVSFSRCLIMPTLFGGDKDNVVLMNNLQLLQSMADKTIVDRPFHSTAADALEALAWLVNLGETQTSSSVNEISARSMNLLANKDVHGYDTRLKDNLRLPHVTKKLGRTKDPLQCIN